MRVQVDLPIVDLTLNRYCLLIVVVRLFDITFSSYANFQQSDTV